MYDSTTVRTDVTTVTLYYLLTISQGCKLVEVGFLKPRFLGFKNLKPEKSEFF